MVAVAVFPTTPLPVTTIIQESQLAAHRSDEYAKASLRCVARIGSTQRSGGRIQWQRG